MIASGSGHPYSAAAYGACFAEHGRPLFHEPWQVPLLLRPIAGTQWHDAAGCYPLTLLDDVRVLAPGLDALRHQGAVSLVTVCDPLVMPPVADMAAAFDICRPFKTHYVVDFSRPFGINRPAQRRHYRIATAAVSVELCDFAAHFDLWCSLYAELVVERQITGVAAFGAEHFSGYRHLAGLDCFRAVAGDEVVALALFARSGSVVHYHLVAAGKRARATRALYAVFPAVLKHYSGYKALNLGGAPGNSDDPRHGLAYFKSGFANTTAESYICGAVLDPERYGQLAGADADSAGFFPAYRQPSQDKAEGNQS
jgi:hypothetical protein